MEMMQIRKYLVIAGLVMVVIGLLLWFLGSKFTWFGNLPGDIRVEKEGYKFYFPLMTCLLISLVLTLIIWLIRKFGS
jgi:H+/Cl- antiporter ClcA